MQHAAALSATVVAAGAGTADSFAVLEASLGPGAVIPNHVHRHAAHDRAALLAAAGIDVVPATTEEP